jgi:Transposase DDE domain
MGAYERREGLGLAERGDDHQKSATALADKGGHCILAWRKTRRVKSAALALTTPSSRPWGPIDPVVRRHRRLQWDTLRLATRGKPRQRMACRVRPTSGYLRSVGKVELVCAAWRHRPDGRRQYRAGHDLRAPARQIVTGYRRRWAVELLHKTVQQHLGFEDIAPHGFDAVLAQVHWVGGAYMLLHMSPPGLCAGVQRIGDKQRALPPGRVDKEKRQSLQKLTHIGGVQRDKDELRQALAGIGGLERQVCCGSQGGNALFVQPLRFSLVVLVPVGRNIARARERRYARRRYYPLSGRSGLRYASLLARLVLSTQRLCIFPTRGRLFWRVMVGWLTGTRHA